MKSKLFFLALAVQLLLTTATVNAAPFSWDRNKPNNLRGEIENFKIAQIMDDTLVILTHDYAPGYYFGLTVENSKNLEAGQRLSSAIKSDTTNFGERLFEKDLICEYWKKTRKGAKERTLFDCTLENNKWTGKF